MNVREDKMTYQFGLKIILVLCVPVLFRIIRRAKREYILFDVVKWVVQLNNYKHDIRNSKKKIILLISSNKNKRLTNHQRTRLIL